MMNWKVCGRKWSWYNLRYYKYRHLPGGPGKTTKTSVRISGLQADI
jgi:hypothetical protein